MDRTLTRELKYADTHTRTHTDVTCYSLSNSFVYLYCFGVENQGSTVALCLECSNSPVPVNEDTNQEGRQASGSKTVSYLLVCRP